MGVQPVRGWGRRVQGSREAGEVTEGLSRPREVAGAPSSLLNEEGRHVPSDPGSCPKGGPSLTQALGSPPDHLSHPRTDGDPEADSQWQSQLQNLNTTVPSFLLRGQVRLHDCATPPGPPDSTSSLPPVPLPSPSPPQTSPLWNLKP